MKIEGVTLTENLLKHANAPKMLTQKHPHKKYNDLPRIELKMIDPQLKQWEKQMNPDGMNPEWFNDIDLTKINCDCPHKDKFEKLFDKDNPEIDAMVWTACKHTTIAAAKRQMKLAPTPDEEVAQDFIQHSINIIEKEVGDDLTHFGYSVNDWYNHLTTNKQKALQPVIQYYQGNTKDLNKRDTSNIQNKHYTGILKEEVQPLDGKPRMVCSVPQSTKYIMGPVTWQLEEIFAHKLQGYCGGKNLDEMADMINNYLALGFTKVVEGDGSAFDNTQDVSLKELDRYIYNRIEHSIYHVPKDEFHEVSQALYKTMDIQYIKNNKKVPLLQYKILGTVFSGDCDTTLMNTTRMAMYNRYVNDKAGLRYGVDYICFSKGDDFTLMYKPYVSNEFITQAYYKYFLDAVPDPSQPSGLIKGLGQVLKFLEFGDAKIIKFCSLNAWWLDTTETKIYLSRDIAKFLTLSKYSRKAKAYNPKMLVKYLVDVAQAMKINYGRIKALYAIAQYHYKLAEDIARIHNIRMPDTALSRMVDYIRIIKGKLFGKNDTLKYIELNIQFFQKMEQDNSENVKHREDTTKQILDDYWEDVKFKEMQHTQQLTEQQADYINRQIECSLFSEYIKSIYDNESKLQV